MEVFYNVKEAADKLDLSVRGVREKINAGEIKAFKRFGRWYIFHADLVKQLRG